MLPESSLTDAPLSLKVPDLQAALKLIEDSSRAGTFVPVLGFEISCLQAYNTTPRNARQAFGSMSTQLRELARQRARIQSAIRLLGENSQEARYLNQFTPASGDVAGPEDSDDGQMIHLTKNLAALACELTRIWSWWHQYNPSPLGSAVPEEPVDPSIVNVPDAVVAMRRSLDCCAQLFNRREMNGREPNSLHIEWVYEKLLSLASQIFDRGKLWSESDFSDDDGLTAQDGNDFAATGFRERHGRFIAGREQETNWSEHRSGGPFEPLSASNSVGIRLSHLIWLQGLLRHVLLCGTRAYRTRTELAFLLSLDDKILQLPDIAADPFEIGLLYAGAVDKNTLTDVLRFCEGSGPTQVAAEPEIPQVFYWALARFLKHERAKLANQRFRPCKQVILSMCLDREMERALAREFPSFRVAFPVVEPLIAANLDKPGWLFIECESDGTESSPGYRVTRFLDPTPDDFLESGGPLIVKMFGSPLESLPDPGSHVPLVGFLEPGQRFSHRLVLDETALLSSFDSFVPREIGEMTTKLSRGRFFYFGQNAIRWSERVPYSLARTLEGREHGGGAAKGFSIGETGMFGATALEKLHMHYAGEGLRPTQIVSAFISKVAESV
jgi:hypothetical protein